MKTETNKVAPVKPSISTEYTLRPIWRFVCAVFASPIVPALLIVPLFIVLERMETQETPTDIAGTFLNAYLGLFMVNVMLCLPAMVILSRITRKTRWFALTGAGCLIVFSILAWGFLGAPLSLASVLIAAVLGMMMMIVLKKLSGY